MDALLSPRPASLWDNGAIREPDCSRGKRWLSACCLVEVETDGVLLVMYSPMRERDWSRFEAELTDEEPPVCPLDAAGVCISLLEMRERRSELRVWEFKPVVLSDVFDLSDLSDPVVIGPPMRDLDSSELVRLVGFEIAAPARPPVAMPDCAAVGADGLVVIGIFGVVPAELSDLPGLSDLSDLVAIGLPIREDRPELIVLRPESCVLGELDPGELSRVEDGD